MKTKVLLSDSKELVLKRQMPGCPKGRTLMKYSSGNGFFVAMTDKEAIEGEIKFYAFTNEEVNKNPQWFRKK